MSEDDLELLITTDDPGEETLEEDTFHLQAETTVRGPFPKRRRPEQLTEVIENDPSKSTG